MGLSLSVVTPILLVQQVDGYWVEDIRLSAPSTVSELTVSSSVLYS
jgi:hypothetical protein